MKKENRLDKDTQQNTAQLLQMAKEKLRWFTMEASEEEFDENTVDALVNLIAAMEQERETPEDGQKELERFHAYCEFYEQEEARRRGSVDNKGAEKVKSVYKKPRLKGKVKKFSKGRRLGFVAAAAGVLLMIAVGGTGVARAGEDSGFFVWLRKDSEGVFGVTSQDAVELNAEIIRTEKYDIFDDIPEGYKKYIVGEEQIGLLNKYEFNSFENYESVNAQRLMERFTSIIDNTEICIGVCIYQDMLFWKEEYDEYELVGTNYMDENAQDVFAKKADTGEMDYYLCFYDDNKKYFVQGKGNIDILENICNEYMKYIYKK